MNQNIDETLDNTDDDNLELNNLSIIKDTSETERKKPKKKGNHKLKHDGFRGKRNNYTEEELENEVITEEAYNPSLKIAPKSYLSSYKDDNSVNNPIELGKDVYEIMSESKLFKMDSWSVFKADNMLVFKEANSSDTIEFKSHNENLWSLYNILKDRDIVTNKKNYITLLNNMRKASETDSEEITEKTVDNLYLGDIMDFNQMNWVCKRRLPNKNDFNFCYQILLEKLNTPSKYSRCQIFVEYAYYFSDKLQRMFQLLDKKHQMDITLDLGKDYGLLAKNKLDDVEFF